MQTINREDLEVLQAMELIRKHREKNKKSDEGFEKVVSLIDMIIAVAKKPIVCSKCGTNEHLYVVID